MFKKSDFYNDLSCGCLSGILTGIAMGPIEYFKVIVQTSKNSFSQNLKLPETYLKMLKSIPQFSAICFVVLGLEFSVNERIRKFHGDYAGIVASAITGATFLTIGDHLMLRREKGETTSETFRKFSGMKIRFYWTGFIPMIMREGIFITSVMHLGPRVGKFLKNSSDDNASIKWNSIGRIVTGIFLTFLSQPFDTLARKMQIDLFNNPEKKPSIISSFQLMHKEYESKNLKLFQHPLFKGAIPRMGVVTFGGAFAGGYFEFFKKKFGSIEH